MKLDSVSRFQKLSFLSGVGKHSAYKIGLTLDCGFHQTKFEQTIVDLKQYLMNILVRQIWEFTESNFYNFDD